MKHREETKSGVIEDLRQWAEKKGKTLSSSTNNENEVTQLLYELRVRQLELEMQNQELNRTKQELEDSRARYFDLYNLAPVGYCTIDKEGVILEANLTAANLLGGDRGGLLNKPIAGFVHPEDRPVYVRHCEQLFDTATPQSCAIRILRPDAGLCWVRLAANLAYSVEGRPMCRIVISDINDLKAMEESLRKSELKYRTVADFTNDWEFWLSPEGEFLYCSPSCKRITGHSAKAFENDPALLRALVHPNDLQAFDQHCEAARNEQAVENFEFRIIRADGSIRWIWLSQASQPVYDEGGRFLGTRGSSRDITLRKNLQDEVLRDRNLESLGVLASGIAHDFNNLFQGIFGNLSLAKANTAKSSKAYQFLESAEKVFDLAVSLTGQLSAFASGNVTARIPIRPADSIREEATASVKESGIDLEFDLPSDLRPIHGDPHQFRQLIKCMVQNAVEAMDSRPAGKIRIAAANEEIKGGGHGKGPGLASGEYVKITVKDEGRGICRENLPRIFDPYYSTKERGPQKGMGLGLALCDTIVRKHGGAIKVKSKLGQGTAFDIYLPAVAIPGAKTFEVSPTLRAAGPRILVMDDDPIVLQVAKKLLSNAGFRADSASDGETAISAYKKAQTARDPYAVIIMDLSIPGGMGAKEVIPILKKIDPQVKAIISSGYVTDPAMVSFAKHGFAGACPKPYHFGELKEIIDRLIAEAPADAETAMPGAVSGREKVG